MVISSALFLATTLLSLIALLAVIFIYGFILWRKDQELREQRKLLDKKMATLLVDAEKQAKKQIQEATDQAGHIIKEALTLKDTIAQDLEKSYQQLLSHHQKNTEQALRDLEVQQLKLLEQTRDEYKSTTTTILKEFHEKGEQILAVFADTMKEEVIKAHIGVEEKIDTEYSQIKKEIADYKQHQIDTIRQSVKDIVSSVSQEVIAQTISTDDHEKLVIDALERAKKEHFFSL